MAIALTSCLRSDRSNTRSCCQRIAPSTVSGASACVWRAVAKSTYPRVPLRSIVTGTSPRFANDSRYASSPDGSPRVMMIGGASCRSIPPTLTPGTPAATDGEIVTGTGAS